MHPAELDPEPAGERRQLFEQQPAVVDLDLTRGRDGGDIAGAAILFHDALRSEAVTELLCIEAVDHLERFFVDLFRLVLRRDRREVLRQRRTLADHAGGVALLGFHRFGIVRLMEVHGRLPDECEACQAQKPQREQILFRRVLCDQRRDNESGERDRDRKKRKASPDKKQLRKAGSRRQAKQREDALAVLQHHDDRNQHAEDAALCVRRSEPADDAVAALTVGGGGAARQKTQHDGQRDDPVVHHEPVFDRSDASAVLSETRDQTDGKQRQLDDAYEVDEIRQRILKACLHAGRSVPGKQQHSGCAEKQIEQPALRYQESEHAEAEEHCCTQRDRHGVRNPQRDGPVGEDVQQRLADEQEEQDLSDCGRREIPSGSARHRRVTPLQWNRSALRGRARVC